MCETSCGNIIMISLTVSDTGGWDWTNQITSCGSDVQCNEVRRIDVGVILPLNQFQQTGYLVERFYKAGYGDGTGTSTFGGQHLLPVPIIQTNEFLIDTQRLGREVVVWRRDGNSCSKTISKLTRWVCADCDSRPQCIPDDNGPGAVRQQAKSKRGQCVVGE
jgi:hypothetical protein